MAEDENDEVPKLPPDARLESLDARLDRLQQAEAAKKAKTAVDPNMRVAQLVIGYLIGGPLGGAASCFHDLSYLWVLSDEESAAVRADDGQGCSGM